VQKIANYDEYLLLLDALSTFCNLNDPDTAKQSAECQQVWSLINEYELRMEQERGYDWVIEEETAKEAKNANKSN
jgi:hypothetical protein